MPRAIGHLRPGNPVISVRTTFNRGRENNLMLIFDIRLRNFAIRVLRRTERISYCLCASTFAVQSLAATVTHGTLYFQTARYTRAYPPDI